jgi:hypothetical protein
MGLVDYPSDSEADDEPQTKSINGNEAKIEEPPAKRYVILLHADDGSPNG